MFVVCGLAIDCLISYYLLDAFGPRTSMEILQLLEMKGRQPFYSCSPAWNICQLRPSSPVQDSTSGQAQPNTWHEEMTMAFFDFEKNKFDQPFEELVLSYNLYLPVGWGSGDFFEFSHYRKLCVQVGRYFKEMLLQRNEGRSTPQQVSWSSHYRVSQQCTLRKLLQWCRPISRGISQDGPETNDNFLWLDIYEILCDTNHVSNLDTRTVVYDQLSLDSPIQDVLEKKYSISRDFYLSIPTTPYNGEKHFTPSDVCFGKITKVGGLKLEWTHYYREHLQIKGQTLSVFWDIGVIQQSGLFWLPPHESDVFDLGLS
jgi:hypothetical protein